MYSVYTAYLRGILGWLKHLIVIHIVTSLDDR